MDKDEFKFFLLKAQSSCAYQERYQQEIRDKLYEWKAPREIIEPIISQLINDNFLNEERYAKTYAGGKFRIKNWGRIKIKLELKRRGITPYCINKGLKEIEETAYRNTIKKLIAAKSKTLKEAHPLKRKHKIVQYLISKGFESELVLELLED